MKKSGTTQVTIARSVGVSAMTVSQVIHGTTTSRRVAQAISEAIGIPMDTLWPERYSHPKRAAA